ncbi:MAG: SprT-like domain-containing protein [Verrucomicrobiales bacterium]|nr:SprT-like domain-containing protein [Verrucomicrobiales bacterium]MED5587104.1 SprT-like domain-containing protein [Verrucomicrobiota bacterium]
MVPEYRQLNFELPDLVEQRRPVKKARSPRRRPKPAKPAELLGLFEVVLPPNPVKREQIAQERGLKIDVGLTAQARELVEAIDLGELAEQLQVYWNPRLITTAGLAHHSTSRIDLNTRLIEFPPDEPGRTLRHELAHIVAHHRAAGRVIQPHGPEWREACNALGIPGERRCHDLPLARRSVRRKFAYQCRYCGIIVPRVRKLSRDSACYPCCRAHNRGRYSRRFLLDPMPLAKARKLAPEHSWA